METVLLIIYAAASYWATNKVLYEGKVVFYSSAYVHLHEKFLIGMMIWLDTDSDCDFKMHFFQIGLERNKSNQTMRKKGVDRL